VPPETVAQETFEPSVVRNLPELLVCVGRTAFAAPAWVVAPVPPFASARVPASVIVPEPVIGPPEVVRPVVPPETATEVTVPLPPDGVAQVPSPRRKVVEEAVPEPRRAVPTVPVERFDALRAVRAEPSPLKDVPDTAPVSVIAVPVSVMLVAVLLERATCSHAVPTVYESFAKSQRRMPSEAM